MAAGLGACCQPGMAHEASVLAIYVVRRVLECTCKELKARWPPSFAAIEEVTSASDGILGHSGGELLAAMALVAPADLCVHRMLVEGCI